MDAPDCYSGGPKVRDWGYFLIKYQNFTIPNKLWTLTRSLFSLLSTSFIRLGAFNFLREYTAPCWKRSQLIFWSLKEKFLFSAEFSHQLKDRVKTIFSYPTCSLDEITPKYGIKSSCWVKWSEKVFSFTV